jgi:LacI family transcriptional regulator
MPSRCLLKVGVFVESSREAGRNFLRGIAEYVRTHGQWSVYWHTEGQTAPHPAVKLNQLDGVIVRDVGLVDEALALGTPCVAFGHTRPELPGAINASNLINVETESEVIGRMAAEHLLSCGFHYFAYCGLSTSARPIRWCELRHDGFARRIAQAGLRSAAFAPPSSIEADWARERHALVQWLRSLPHPVGCMAANDDRASELAAACKEAGLAVPDQVGIIGVDNDELVCGFSDPPLSSIKVEFERSGYEAAEALSQLMNRRGDTPRTIIASANQLVVRRSTDFVAAEDVNLAKALRFIRENAETRMLAVSEVAQFAGLSRRSLERRFRENIGHSIHYHIARLRAERIGRLLAETTLTVAEIAEQLGFADLQHFARFFRAHHGVTPLEYRKQRQMASA